MSVRYICCDVTMAIAASNLKIELPVTVIILIIIVWNYLRFLIAKMVATTKIPQVIFLWRQTSNLRSFWQNYSLCSQNFSIQRSPWSINHYPQHLLRVIFATIDTSLSRFFSLTGAINSTHPRVYQCRTYFAQSLGFILICFVFCSF